MHPNLYLRTFWRNNFDPSIFVAMSFSTDFDRRFTKIIEPAIESVSYRDNTLKAFRVDVSKSGDSILTEINNGIAHSVMILADVSTIGNDSKSGYSYRNANVMYEVGLALACRHSAEVLLIRDDKDPFLFDVSTIPHKHIDFSDADSATRCIRDEVNARLNEIDHIRDARIAVAIASLTAGERTILLAFSKYDIAHKFWLTKENLASMAALSRLLDKQLIRTAGITHDHHGMFNWTELGRATADKIEELVPVFDFSPPDTGSTDDGSAQ